MKKFIKKITFPTFLTIVRLIVGFFIVPMCIVAVCPYNTVYGNLFVSLLFLLVAFTDFLDGYFARLYKQESYVGSVLDPLADKFLMFATWVALLAVGKLWYGWVLLLMGREFLITTLRSLSVEKNFIIPVSWNAKVKTTIHIVCFAFIIFNPYQNSGAACVWNMIESVLLGASVYFSLYSAWQYSVIFFNAFENEERSM